jgi:hypothetical protein
MTPSINQAETALRLIARKIPDFPCDTDKRPFSRQGFKNASADPNTVREWWRRNPDALIGVPTGER